MVTFQIELSYIERHYSYNSRDRVDKCKYSDLSSVILILLLINFKDNFHLICEKLGYIIIILECLKYLAEIIGIDKNPTD